MLIIGCKETKHQKYVTSGADGPWPWFVLILKNTLLTLFVQKYLSFCLIPWSSRRVLNCMLVLGDGAGGGLWENKTLNLGPPEDTENQQRWILFFVYVPFSCHRIVDLKQFESNKSSLLITRR